VYRKTEKLLPRTKRKLFKEENPWHFEPDLFHVSSNIYLDGYWQHYKYFENISPQILKELVVKEAYSPSIKIISNSIINDVNSVSIHIRRGDYLTDKEAFQLMGLMPINYYKTAINYIKQKLTNPNFYIFSDDLDWVKSNLKIDAPTYYIDGGKDYIDLELMSKCKHNIIANSSFSWWAAFLNNNSAKIVIAPNQWVVPPEINKRIELIFPSWIKI
ncbi:alpha-1,2-fucosyltransferase, partial [bacterium]